jgi:hypothetical protein
MVMIVKKKKRKEKKKVDMWGENGDDFVAVDTEIGVTSLRSCVGFVVEVEGRKMEERGDLEKWKVDMMWVEMEMEMGNKRDNCIVVLYYYYLAD